MPNRIFEFYFLDQDFDEQYRAEERFSNVFTTFSVIAILIACLGLYGLASFTAEQKVKEIGVRKVLGASVGGLVVLLSSNFVKLVLVSFVLAAPMAYFFMDSWLDGFAERTSIPWTVFVIAAGFSVIISILTVSYQSIKAAMSNPIKSLRYE